MYLIVLGIKVYPSYSTLDIIVIFQYMTFHTDFLPETFVAQRTSMLFAARMDLLVLFQMAQLFECLRTSRTLV